MVYLIPSRVSEGRGNIGEIIIQEVNMETRGTTSYGKFFLQAPTRQSRRDRPAEACCFRTKDLLVRQR